MGWLCSGSRRNISFTTLNKLEVIMNNYFFRICFLSCILFSVSGCGYGHEYWSSQEDALLALPGSFNVNKDSLKIHTSLPSPVENNRRLFLYEIELDSVLYLTASQVETDSNGMRRVDSTGYNHHHIKNESIVLEKLLTDDDGQTVATVYYGWLLDDYTLNVLRSDGTVSEVNVQDGYFMGVFKDEATINMVDESGNIVDIQ